QNTNQHSGDYSNIKNVFRPGHADFTYTQKYGIRDYRGGGRASGRETCARVAAGAIAKLFLKEQGISITAYTERAAGISCTKFDASQIEQNTMRAPDADAAKLMEEKIAEIRKAGDSTGGIIACRIDGVPSGLGEPVFEKADALLAQAMLSIGAIKGIEFGCGFNCADMTGSQNNDVMQANSDKSVCFKTNNAGGILGGITNSDQIFFRCAIKPVPSIYQSQQTVDIHGNECDLLIEGRHDICLCPRIVPVIEAMAAITITDLLLRNRATKA
ncbi:MAG TPA: chorismate synthase, partial [Treponema sp.]|nr:chorismate synthase [Treponema sp.]